MIGVMYQYWFINLHDLGREYDNRLDYGVSIQRSCQYPTATSVSNGHASIQRPCQYPTVIVFPARAVHSHQVSQVFYA